MSYTNHKKFPYNSKNAFLAFFFLILGSNKGSYIAFGFHDSLVSFYLQ